MITINRRSFVKAAVGTTLGAGIGMPFIRTSTATDPSITGAWSGVYTWPCVAIHLHLLPDGNILTWADDDSVMPDRLADFSKAFVVSIPTDVQPSTTFTEVDNRVTNLFCAGHTFLPDGRLLVVGGPEGAQYVGSADTTIFDPATYSWETRTDAPMFGGRWYASALTLGNGEVVVVSGTRNSQGDNNPLPQVWETGKGGGWRNLVTAQLSIPFYPSLFLAPDGRVYCSGSSQGTRYLNTSGTGKWSAGPKRIFGERFYGASVMYDEAKILMAGGGNPPTATAEVIDLAASTPAWKSTGSMAFARRHCTAVVLPDGKVLVVNGSGSPGNDAAKAVLPAELWLPGTGKWTTMASMAVKRLYHSTAILLPDARVLVAGGGRPSAIHGGADNANAEIFSPPYLFQGPRPTITSAPKSVTYGDKFLVPTPDASSIDKVRLVRLGSVTHTVNMNQRAKVLQFQRQNGKLKLTVPSDPNTLPPGHYMLFILRGGVPSIAKIIQVKLPVV